MKVETDDLVDIAEAATIIGLENPKGVSVYRKRYANFPAPAIEKGRCLLWRREDILRWVNGRP